MNRRPSRPLSLRALLLFTLVLPLVVATGFGGMWANDRREEAQRAQMLASQVDVLCILGQLEFSNDFSRLFGVPGGPSRLDGLSLDDDAASDIRVRIARLWDGGRRLLDNPTILDQLTDGRGSTVLGRILARRDAATADPSALTDESIRTTAAELRRLMQLVRDSASFRAVESTDAFDLIGELQQSMLIEARQFLQAFTSAGKVAPTDAVAILELGAEQDALVDQITTRIPPGLGQRLHEGLSTDDVALLRQALAAEAGIMDYPLTFVETVTPDRIARIANRYLTLPEIRADVAAGLHRRTAAATAQADRWASAALALAATMGIITIATAVVVNRMVLRRLESLGEAAQRIAHGELDDSVLPEGGAREIAEVTHAFNRMSQLLLTLERQVGAISAARLDDPSLEEPLPGRIGSQLQQSVRLIAATNERLHHQATHDELTGLPNRAALATTLSSIRRGADDAPIALLCVDLDRFKYVNDVHGHRNGDRVIQVVAARLAAVAGVVELARIDGDEFALVMRPTVPADHDRALTEIVAATARSIVDELARPLTVAGERLVLQSCVGIAIDADGRDATDLLRPAEVAMSRAKAAGPGSVAVHDDTMTESIERRTRLEQRLRVALATDQLEMHAQPIVDLATEEILGVELLARWRLDGEWIPPDVFIGIAEECGLIQAVGRWGLRRAVEVASDLRAAGHDLSVSVNISGLHLLTGEVGEELEALLTGTAIDPALLRIELTESVLVTDPDLAAERLGDIRRLGAKVVIDDFGTGYSSLTYLHSLPIDGIKLDRSFVSRLDQPGSDPTIVHMVNDLAEGLSLDLVAEGVETVEQRDALRAHGYPKGQGYLWSRPVPLEQLGALLHDRNASLRPVDADAPPAADAPTAD